MSKYNYKGIIETQKKEKIIEEYMCFSSNELVEILIDRDLEIERLENIIKEVREYITSYKSISTIQGLNNLEVLNDGLDYKTIKEMTNRYLKVHDKILEILDKGE